MTQKMLLIWNMQILCQYFAAKIIKKHLPYKLLGYYFT